MQKILRPPSSDSLEEVDNTKQHIKLIFRWKVLIIIDLSQLK